MSNYGAYKLQDVWKMTLTQVNELCRAIDMRDSVRLRLLFTGYRASQHSDGTGFNSFIKSLVPNRVDKG